MRAHKSVASALAVEPGSVPNESRQPTSVVAERAALLELSFDAILVRDCQDRITYWNRGAEQMYGWSREEAIGKVTHELFRTQFPEPLSSIMRKLKQDARWTGELVHRRCDGRLLIVVTRWALQLDTTGYATAILEINTDITERKRAEESLRRRQQELAAFFEESPLGLLWVGANGRILRANQALLELLGRSGTEVQGRRLVDFSAGLEAAEDLLNRLVKGETVSSYRLRLRHKTGAVKHVLIDANALWEEQSFVYSRWFVRDITLRVELEQEILEISEREQRRLGQDLHDDLCQQLSGIEFLSQTLAATLSPTCQCHARQAKEIAAMVRTAMVQTRELARGLSPLRLKADGLMLALQELAARTRKLFARDCRFWCAAPVLVRDQTAAVHLYRIAQEAVTNAVKHGQAQRIQIRLSRHRDGFKLVISDNGIGISSSHPKSEGMGSRIMHYRAEVIGASLRIGRNPHGGTSVVCAVVAVRQRTRSSNPHERPPA